LDYYENSGRGSINVLYSLFLNLFVAYEIILGRHPKDKEKFGLTGSVFIGKHYVKMGRVTALAQEVYLDLNKAHVLFVAGKRGSGKSYSLGVIAEGIATLPEDFSKRLSVIMLDTMGIYWTMKYPNHKDEQLLKEWGLEGKAIPNVKIYTPAGFYEEYKEKGIPTDESFSIAPWELGPDEWFLAFELEANDPIAVFIERTVLEMKKKGKYSIKDIIKVIESDDKEQVHVKQAASNRFRSADEWGLFSDKATPIKDLAKGGQITVLDLSAYVVMPNGWRIKHLALGLVSQKMFIERMAARKDEEYQSITKAVHYITADDEEKQEMPLVWLMIDEAHEFLPFEGKTSSTQPLKTLLREGRQPGVAMVMATQQPGKIHTDAMTQSDIILSHRLTAKIDTDALANLLQSYMRGAIDRQLDTLPRVAGSCIAIDDVNERLYPMKVRPRFSWHGGGAPEIITKKKNAFEFNLKD
jgi:DNA helicase HerA-like ATPase